MYHFRVTVTLTSDLVFRIIVSGVYLLYYLSWESHIWCLVASWDGRVSCTKLWVTVTLTYFLDLSCQEHIYIFLGRNPKLGVWMHLWMAICHGPSQGPCDLVSRIIVSGAYIIEVGIPNLVCGFLLGWRSGAYQFGSF